MTTYNISINDKLAELVEESIKKAFMPIEANFLDLFYVNTIAKKERLLKNWKLRSL